MDWNTVLGSAVIAALISALVTKIVADRKIYAENITKERAKWRERIRRISQEYPTANDDQKIRLEMEFSSRLNPFHPEDLKLLDALNRSSKSNNKELSIRVSLLLKHDWERAKNEAKSIFTRRINPVRRLTYEEYMESLRHIRSGNEEGFVKEIARLTEDEPWM